MNEIWSSHQSDKWRRSVSQIDFLFVQAARRGCSNFSELRLTSKLAVLSLT